MFMLPAQTKKLKNNTYMLEANVQVLYPQRVANLSLPMI